MNEKDNKSSFHFSFCSVTIFFTILVAIFIVIESPILNTNHIAIAQQKQKNRHDRQINHLYQFEIGDKVLYYNAAKDKQWSGKLNLKWKEPYYIHQVLMNRSYKIREIDERVLRIPVNGNLLKSLKLEASDCYIKN